MRVAFLRMASVLTLALIPVSIAACSSDKGAGSLLGAFTGGEAGTQKTRGPDRSTAKASGSVVGGISRNEIGREMSTRERGVAANAEYRALEYGRSGAPVAWDYPAMSHRGSIVPGRPFKKGEQYCRTYTHTINRGDAPEAVKGIACRETNGTWRTTS